MTEVQRRLVSPDEVAGMKGIVTFDFDKWKDKESVIENLVIMETNKPSKYPGASNKFMVIESASLGIHEMKKDNVTTEKEIRAAESFSVIEQDGKITGWPASGGLQQLMDLLGVKNPNELIGKKIRSAKKQNKSGKVYLGWYPI